MFSAPAPNGKKGQNGNRNLKVLPFQPIGMPQMISFRFWRFCLRLSNAFSGSLLEEVKLPGTHTESLLNAT